MPDLAI